MFNTLAKSKEMKAAVGAALVGAASAKTYMKEKFDGALCVLSADGIQLF